LRADAFTLKEICGFSQRVVHRDLSESIDGNEAVVCAQKGSGDYSAKREAKRLSELEETPLLLRECPR
jgi:hypothetical protein